jgi:hypothetical protein
VIKSSSTTAQLPEEKRPLARISATRVPIPPPPPESPTFFTRLTKSPGILLEYLWYGTKTVVTFTFWTLPKGTIYFLRHPTEFRKRWGEFKQSAKDELHHYWVGSKVRGMIKSPLTQNGAIYGI